MAKKFEVNSLSEYVNFVSRNNLNNFISRGENKKFDGIIASAFRYQTPIKFQNMILQFYNTIGNDVTNMQRENFVAFSQHHGIPTNLIDFSLSPLVSLFFACYDTDTNSDKSGDVYFINKSRLISINEMVNSFTLGDNLFQKLMQFNLSIAPIIAKLYTYEHTHTQEVQKIIIDWTSKLKVDLIRKRKYKNLFQIINQFRKESKLKTEYTLHSFSQDFDTKYTYSEKILEQLIKSNQDYNKQYSNFSLYDEEIANCYKLIEVALVDRQYVYDKDILLMLLLMRTVFEELFDYRYTRDLIKTFDLPFYFSYSPPNILSRIENQSSLFVYQLYYDYDLIDPYIEETEHRMIQNISPDYILKVNCKEEILDALDSVGINLKFIYSDYDNIAKYIKSKSLGL